MQQFCNKSVIFKIIYCIKKFFADQNGFAMGKSRKIFYDFCIKRRFRRKIGAVCPLDLPRAKKRRRRIVQSFFGYKLRRSLHDRPIYAHTQLNQLFFRIQKSSTRRFESPFTAYKKHSRLKERRHKNGRRVKKSTIRNVPYTSKIPIFAIRPPYAFHVFAG